MEALFPKFFSGVEQAGNTLVRIFNVAESIGYVLVIILIIGTIYCAILLSRTGSQQDEELENHFIKRKHVTSHPNMDRWKKVAQAINSPDEQLWRLAIIDADTMLEEVIDSMGIYGETLGEKMKGLGNQVSWIDAAWEAHKLRNILAHEGGRYHLNQREAYRAFKIYEGILHETGYLS